MLFEAVSCDFDISWTYFNSYEISMKVLGSDTSGSASTIRVKNYIPYICHKQFFD